MRFFVTKDLGKNSALKLIILFSLIFFLGLIITNFLFMYKIGFTPSSVTDYYLVILISLESLKVMAP